MAKPPEPIPMIAGAVSSRSAAPTKAAGYTVVDETFAQTLATSHQRAFEVVARETVAGPEAITADVPNCIAHGLDERGLAVVGTRVRSGDILVGKATPWASGPASPEEKLLRAIFGESGDMRDTSMRMPPWLEGTVTGAELLEGSGPGEIARAQVVVSWERPLEIGDELDAGGRRVTVSEIRPAPHPVAIDGRPAGGGVEVVRRARDVIEARAIGPYAPVSQQPVGGRESYGGQAITAAQRHALAAAGASATLAELLGVKSDWILGRTCCYESLVKSEDPEIRPRPPAPPASEPGAGRDIFSFFDRAANKPEMTRSAAVFVAHARALGLEISGFPLPARVELMSPEAIRELSCGEVKKPETINDKSHRPEPGGLFCQKIFGPVADYECACGKYRRMKYRGQVCETCGVEVIGSRVRAERFGHIELAMPVPHPRIAGAVLEAVPVLPPDLRPLVSPEGGRDACSDVNDLYRRVINRNNRLARLRELDAPETIVADETAALAQAIAALLHNERLARPVTDPDDRPLRSLAGLLPELGRAMLDKRVDYSGAAPLVVDPSLGARACRIPRVLARELFRPWVYGALERHGYVATIKSAKRMVEADRAEALEALESESRGVPIVLVSGDRLVARELGLWDHPAIAVDPGTAAALGVTFVQVHVPLSAAARAECAALPDCPEPRPVVPGGWLSAALASDDPIAVLCEAARTGEGDGLEDPQLKTVFGL